MEGFVDCYVAVATYTDCNDVFTSVYKTIDGVKQYLVNYKNDCKDHYDYSEDDLRALDDEIDNCILKLQNDGEVTFADGYIEIVVQYNRVID